MSVRADIALSPAAQRMLSTVSPVYDDAYAGCWLFEAIGRELDSAWTMVDSLPAQAYLATATWAMRYWEERFGVIPDETLALAQRRARILAKFRGRSPINPKRIETAASGACGYPARVEEYPARYAFRVFVNAPLADEQAIRRTLDRIKPAHLAFDVKYELFSRGEFHSGSAITYGRKYTLKEAM